MAIVTLDDTNLTNIATAIRAKGVEGTFTPSQMAQAIDGIQTGGGGKVWASGDELGYLYLSDQTRNSKMTFQPIGKFVWPAGQEKIKVHAYFSGIPAYFNYSVSINRYQVLSGMNSSSSSQSITKDITLTYKDASLSSIPEEDTLVQVATNLESGSGFQSVAVTIYHV